jgi:hypothetical protein
MTYRNAFRFTAKNAGMSVLGALPMAAVILGSTLLLSAGRYVLLGLVVIVSIIIALAASGHVHQQHLNRTD